MNVTLLKINVNEYYIFYVLHATLAKIIEMQINAKNHKLHLLIKALRYAFIIQKDVAFVNYIIYIYICSMT